MLEQKFFEITSRTDEKEKVKAADCMLYAIFKNQKYIGVAIFDSLSSVYEYFETLKADCENEYSVVRLN